MIFGIAFSVFVYNMVDPTHASARREARTAAAMRDVRDALIGWSVQRTSSGALPNARPGELPCPDMNNDGYEDGSCAAGALGRVPWKTLGIPEPRDEAGETLWYAIAGPFRIWNMSSTAINSDTKGNLTVYQDSTATPVTTEAVAVVFAPEGALGTQNRGTTAALCSTTSTTIARNLCAANYLETAASVNNAVTGGPFISAQSSSSFNDKVLVLTTADLMPMVERRVGLEVKKLLQDYKTNTACACTNLGGGSGCYPYADLSNGYSDADPYNPGEGRNRGRVPALGAAPYDWGASPCASPVPNIPAWFVNNDWRLVVYYSAGSNFLIYWDGDESRELLNSNAISKSGGGTLLTASGCSSNNGTKSTPTLTADLIGDWREELVIRESDNSALRVYTTTTITGRRMYTLMHEPTYRMQVSFEQTSYNQPPHVPFHFGAGMADPPTPDIYVK